MSSVEEILVKQRKYYYSGATKSLQARRENLLKLRKAIKENEKDIMKALKTDLNKSEFEAYATEVGIVLEEIRFMLMNMGKLLQPKKVRTPITQFPSVSRIYQEPYGNVLIMAPWNYPFQLSMAPLVGAIACGNCAILKPSNYAPATSEVIHRIISETFEESYVAVVEGGRQVNQSLLELKFDLIFFTGSIEVGKIVMEKAAKHLTPVVLELGGKSPCIVDETADIKMAAKRIAWGKCLNSGQTCVAPDYILVQKSVKQQLIQELGNYVKTYFGENPENNEEFPKIINKKHFERLSKLIQSGKVVYGGNVNEETNQIGFTIMDDVKWEDLIMQEEIFGPIMPILEFDKVEQIIPILQGKAKPLALYLFTRSKSTRKRIIENVSFGGGCINDTVIHLATSNMGFGGVGESGMGSYHGKASIQTFSHAKSVLKKSNRIDIPVRYAPYKNHIKILKMLMK